MTWAIIACSLAATNTGTEEIAEPARNVWPVRLTQAMGGILLEGAGAAAVGVTGLLVGCSVAGDCGDLGPEMLYGFVSGAIIGGTFGATAAVYYIGRADRRDASIWTVLGGSALGLVAAVPISVAGGEFLEASEAAGIAVVVAALTLPTVGAIIAFELSNAAIRRRAAPLSVTASVVPIKGGSALFLASTF